MSVWFSSTGMSYGSLGINASRLVPSAFDIIDMVRRFGILLAVS